MIQATKIQKVIIIIISCGFLFQTGCQDFDPIKKSDHYNFSIYGYLDASADTQWVRVNPAREQIIFPAVKPEMTVTLEELESGNSVVMKDSLFQLANGINFVNAWTTMDVKPEHTYRLMTDQPDGGSSSVTVSTPPEFPKPTLSYPYNDCRPLVNITGVQRLADIEWVFYYKINSSGYIRKRVFRLPYRNWAKTTKAGNYKVFLDPDRSDENILLPAGKVIEEKITIFVASGGPQWNDNITLLNERIYSLPETASNIKNGIGYLVGISSRTMLFECPN